jgi:hypothetical protein
MVSLLPLLLALLFVCTRSRLLVLLNRLAISVKLSRFALEVDARFSVALRCKGDAVAVRLPSSYVLPPTDLDGTSRALC